MWVRAKKTEPIYFEGVRNERHVQERFALTIVPGGGRSAESVVRIAVAKLKGASQRKQKFDSTWCVIDVEAQGEDKTIPAAARLASRHGIQIVWSNPCFERWLLSHFEKTAGHITDCANAIVKLNKHWKKHFRADYRKNDEQLYSRIARRTETAIENAKWAREVHHRSTSILKANSATEVYKLVEFLLK